MLKFEVPDVLGQDQNEFSERQKILFNALEAAEKEHGKSLIIGNQEQEHELSPSENHSLKKIFRSEMKHFRGKESIFKTPHATPSFRKLKKVSSAKKSITHSRKWIKYSLENVKDMSESDNAAAAFSFLQQIERERSPNFEAEKCLDEFKPVYIKSNRENRANKNYDQQKKTCKILNAASKLVHPSDNSSFEHPRVKLNHLSFHEEDE